MTHPLAAPHVTTYRTPTTAPVMVVVITRGVGPLEPVTAAQAQATAHGAGFALVSRFPAVEAKNRAAVVASDQGTALLLVEDDVLADDATWRRMLTGARRDDLPVRYAEARCRNGAPNTRLHADGTPLYSGTPFTLLPLPVLRRLPAPVFVAADYGIADGALFWRGPNRQGHHSDVHLWHTLRQLDPRPAVECVGRVACLAHRLNRETHDLQTPESVEVIGW